MTYCIFILFLFVWIFPALIQCQTGTFMPLMGRLDSLNYIPFSSMITERDCISVCVKHTSPTCYAISHESFRQECRLITQYASPSIIPNQALLNWRTYIRI